MTEENRNFVTPFAFNVSRSLLGKSLASPSKRLFAILVDLILVGLLTTLSALILTGLFGITALVGFNNLRKKPERGLAAGFLLTASIVCALIIAVSMLYQGSDFQAMIEKDGSINAELNLDSGETDTAILEKAQAENTKLEKAQAEETQTEDAPAVEIRVPAESESPSVIAWIQGMITDLGLSFGWAAMYFTVFVAWMNGQTPGKKLFGIQVIAIDGKELSLWESFGRYGGYGAGLATGLLGFLQIYWDPNRQAIQDKISETMVIDLRKPDAEQPVPAESATA